MDTGISVQLYQYLENIHNVYYLLVGALTDCRHDPYPVDNWSTSQGMYIRTYMCFTVYPLKFITSYFQNISSL